MGPAKDHATGYLYPDLTLLAVGDLSLRLATGQPQLEPWTNVAGPVQLQPGGGACIRWGQTRQNSLMSRNLDIETESVGPIGS